MTDRESPSPNRVLLVEGQDDKHVVHHLCSRSERMPSFDIVDKDGIPNLLRSIGPEIKVPGRRAVGILVDANDDLEARWSAVGDRLQIQHFQPPAKPDPTGTVISGRPRIGIWIWPDNECPGELENFVETMIPPRDPVWPLSQVYVDGIPESDRRFSPNKTLKTKLYAWLATRKNPRRMGAAIGAGELDVDGPLATKFADWLRRLFACTG